MLIQVLLADRLRDPAVAGVVQPLVDKAAALRAEAERQAAAGRHAQAVETLERSTAELVRAIRGAGIYIPG